MDEIDNPEISALTQGAEDARDEAIAAQERADESHGLDTAEQYGLESPLLGSPSGPLLDNAVTYNQDSANTQGSTHNTESQDKPQLPRERVALPTRPALRRESSAPRPPAYQQVEPPDPSQDPPDSLTLADLKRIRSGFPTVPQQTQELLPLQRVYDFEYSDTQDCLTELQEWFAYNGTERTVIQGLYEQYEHAWNEYTGGSGEEEVSSWVESADKRTGFVKRQVEKLQSRDEQDKVEALESLCYLVLGNWVETAGLSKEDPFQTIGPDTTNLPSMDEFDKSSLQIHWIVENICLLVSSNAIPAVYEALRKACDRDLAAALQNIEDPNPNEPPKTFNDRDTSVDIWCGLTILYFIVEITRLSGATNDADKLRKDVEPWLHRILDLSTQIIAQMRWDEAAPVPSSKLFLLYWKTMLVSFGSLEDLKKVKQSFQEDKDEKDQRGQPLITASPLDYHLFRQEISSKYPAYQPPQPLFPFEPENNTVLPPLEHRRVKLEVTQNTSDPPAAHPIMHQPVHIATPAPSPPPSPAGQGGKGGKKQNYQTNQMFPFLYPPLDSTSNDIGGKGSTELQDALVGRKWQGSDVPASILEAAELFAKRMRATRGMKQLWEARVEYMKQDRGWRPEDDDLNLDKLNLDDEEQESDKEKSKTPPREMTDVEKRLAAVDDFYRHCLPHMQSVVVVLLKAVLKHIGDLVTATGNRNGLQPGFQETNGGPHVPIYENGDMTNGDPSTDTADQVDNARTTEITCKALTGVLILMLKWFKVSHILRYEYLTQLLLDANYVPLILKLWQTQDIGRACHFRLDNPDLDFFALCRSQSTHPTLSTALANREPATSISSDDAAPPPIKLSRAPASTHAPSEAITDSSSVPDGPNAADFTLHPPEVDELGYPSTPLPTEPIKSFSHRNTTTLTHHARILHYITARKTHRALLLVSYKSSNHLKKSLRVPIAALRYYTLKLFKTQVPYCGRKWRQANMKIITAVWLTLPPELRDDWLIGGGGGLGGQGPGDVDGTVEEALPLEMALRGLCHWWNVRHYGREMGVRDADQGTQLGKRDFFERELVRLGIGADVVERIVGEEIGDDEAELREEGLEGEWVEGY